MVNSNRNCRATRCGNISSSNGIENTNGTLKRLRAIEMAIVETVLYLDSYPENRAALSYYNKLLEERQKLNNILSENGRPMTHLDAGKDGSWNWINSPWPWDIEANL